MRLVRAGRRLGRFLILTAALAGCARTSPSQTTAPREGASLLPAELIDARVVIDSFLVAGVRADTAALWRITPHSQPVSWALRTRQEAPGLLDSAMRKPAVKQATWLSLERRNAIIVLEIPYRQFRSECYPPGRNDLVVVNVDWLDQRWVINRVSMPAC